MFQLQIKPQIQILGTVVKWSLFSDSGLTETIPESGIILEKASTSSDF